MTKASAERKQAAELQKHMEECFSMRQCLGGLSGTACPAPPIESHTIAKRWLRAIARDNHVYAQSFNIFERNKADAKLGMSLIGINKATTYPIYCGAHDGELFRALEQANFDPDERTAAQLHFRAICREAFTKVGANTLARTLVVEPGTEFHKGFSGFAMGNAAALNDAHKHYHNARERLLHQRYDSIRYYACTFERPLPFAYVGAFLPEIDFEGKQLADLSDLTRTPPAIGAACFSDAGRGYCVLTWDPAGEEAREIARTFHLVPAPERADAALALGLEFIENVALAPDWWEGLPADHRKRLHKRLTTAGSPFAEMRQPSALLDRDAVLGNTPVQTFKSNDGLFYVLR
jgi:hypothetical protein